jgi:hypothetical protein
MWTISSKQHTATTTMTTGVEEENDNDIWECSASGTSAKCTLFLKHFKLISRSSFLISVREAARHLAKKINWFSDRLVNAKIVTPEEVSQSAVLKNEAILSTNCSIAFHLNSTSDLSLASEIFQVRMNGMFPTHGDLVSQFALECNVNVDDSNGSAFKSLSSSKWQHCLKEVTPTKFLVLILFFDLYTPIGIHILEGRSRSKRSI